MAVAIGAVTFTACSDDDTSGFVVNDGEKEVTINRLGGTIEVPVSTTGQWTASVSDEARKWTKVWNGEGNGNGTAVVYIDYLDPRKQVHERKSTLTITSGDAVKTIDIRQYIGLVEGEAADNDGGEFYADLWHNKGVGSGFNPLNGATTPDNIINLHGLRSLIKKDPDRYAHLFKQTPGPGAKGVVSLIDTLENNRKSIDAEVGIDVTYAKIKFHLDAHFNNSGKQGKDSRYYNGSWRTTFLSSQIGLGNIMTMLRKDPKMEKEETQMLLTPLMACYYEDIMTAYEDKDDDALKDVVEEMCDQVGPVIVTGAELGGDCVISLMYDKISQQDSFEIGGKINAGIETAVFTLKADIDVTYSKVGEDIWRNSVRSININGGSGEAMSDLLKTLEADTQSMDVLRKSVSEATGKWVESINCYDDPQIAIQKKNEGKPDNTALVHIDYTAIWNLFPPLVARKIKPIVADYYKGKQLITVSPEDLGIFDDNGQWTK